LTRLCAVEEATRVLIVNARVHTLDAEARIGEAVAMRGGVIAAVGTTEDLRAANPGEPEIDAEGRAVLPGLIDAHAHLSNLARAKLGLSVTGAESEERIGRLVAAFAARLADAEWLTGRGWDQNLWESKQFPSRVVLDHAAPGRPVALTRVDGHATWASSAALKAAGIHAETDDPPGGRVLKGDDGEPTGVLIDRAQTLLRRVIPAPSDERMMQAIRDAIDECLRVGLTQIHEMGLDLATIGLYKRLIDRGEFPFRVYGAVGGRGETWDAYREMGPELGYGDDRLTVRSLKLVSDGALGSRGAALLEPYSDDPDNRGIMIIPRDEVTELCRQALAAGFQVCTHAIGDRANREVLDAYEAALASVPAADRRFRMEHAQILTAADLPRFRRLQVLPSMQATHCTSDMPWAEQRLGEQRLRYAYAWRSLLDTSLPILGGSDFPVESPNPFLGIYASVTRQQPDGTPPGGWDPAQRMTRLEAIRSFTTWAAYGAFEEHVRGRIAPGCSADLVMLSQDPFEASDAQLTAILPLMTLVAGETVFDGRNRPIVS
jgi:predicted amidohydrolase YtcJ